MRHAFHRGLVPERFYTRGQDRRAAERPQSMKVAVASDHAGVALKKFVLPLIRKAGHSVIDLGTNTTDPVDYPDYAIAIARAIESKRAQRGVLICGSGVGASVAANKIRGIRAALAHDSYS